MGTSADASSTPEPDRPFVSVIVPVLNAADAVGRTIGSLLGQSYPADRYEVIIVDNGSVDGTEAVVARFQQEHPGRVRLLAEHDRRSSYAARNTGLRHARGAVFAFTDADCEPAHDWIEAGVRALDVEGADYAAGRVDMTFDWDEPNLWEYYDAVGKMNQRRYMERGFGATANLFVDRGAIEAHGPFRDHLVSGGDYELGRRLAKAGRRGVYADSAVVRHPARSTARAILAKELRILRGRRQLEALGALEHGRLSWRSFVPVRRCPPLHGVRPSLWRRVSFILVANKIRYYTLFMRLLGRVLRPLRRRDDAG